MLAWLRSLWALWLAYWQGERAGEKRVQNADRDQTLDAIIREHEAMSRAPSTAEDLARDAKEGKL